MLHRNNVALHKFLVHLYLGDYIMQKQFFEFTSEAGKSWFNSAQQIAEINVNTLGKFVEFQNSALQNAVDSSVNFVKAMGEVKDPQSLFSLQSEWAANVSKQAMDNSQSLGTLFGEAKEAYTDSIEKGVNETVTQFKPKAGKKAA
jgi:hypothetical protein